MPAAGAVAVGAAAQELRLKRGEFAIAVHLGLIRLTVPRDGGRPRVGCVEIERLRSQAGFPEELRERVRTVGTAKGAQQLGISPDRFTKLARAGCLTPITFYQNRYRAIVWLYLADELTGFAARESQLLTGRSPAWLRDRLERGADCRAVNWRSRRVERLLSLMEDPWARVAVLADTLDPVQLAEVVDDPYERAYLARIRPGPAFGPAGPTWARETTAHLMQADEPDEMLWRRVSLITELDNAREVRQAPRPGADRRTFPYPGTEREPKPDSRADTEPGPASAAVPTLPPAASPIPSPGSNPCPSPMSGPVPAPGPVQASTDTAEPAVGLLARIGLRRRTVRAANRRPSPPGRAPFGG
ncbi:DUF6397 family protein [Streptomyces sp. NBC_00378]|uniref:DUF6397 family protein n=1 Tax=Streptomyces sp. NBC_00378 TaxID=2975732 RepID=UPI002259EF98|nr:MULTISPECIES: DUF6397 family protein [unclassified Streptomyces]MCX5107354.1 DUF6397 family protein [Streptomyces sp. NBC_00378]